MRLDLLTIAHRSRDRFRGAPLTGLALLRRFPSSMEMAEECVGFGKDLEALIEMFAEHVISDQEEIIATG
jgi:hypothetical protein